MKLGQNSWLADHQQHCLALDLDVDLVKKSIITASIEVERLLGSVAEEPGELNDFILDMDIDSLYSSKLRECHETDKVHIMQNCNSTGRPRGYVVNVTQEDAIKLEKELIIFSLLKDTVWTVTKIDNVQIALDKVNKQEEFFNSLFDFV